MDGAGGGGAHRRAEVGHLPSEQRGQKGKETNKQKKSTLEETQAICSDDPDLK